jgi:hypothetical protein
MAAMLFGPPPPARKKDFSISVIAHCPHPPHLAGDQVGEVVVVAAAAGDGLPEAVADSHDLFLLGIFHVGRQRQAFWVLGHQGVEVLIHQSLETGPIAVCGDRADRQFRLSHQCGRNEITQKRQQGSSGQSSNAHITLLGRGL